MNGNYKYFIGNSEPDLNWKKLNFDDSQWLTGYKTIGYGDDDDSTIINTTVSLYVRIYFEIEDPALITEANLLIDYDDAFVAYINEKEVVRSNLGEPGEFIPYNRLADRSHEALDYRTNWRSVKGYYLNDTTIKNTFKSGTNILAVQVHNDSINGSDLSLRCDLYDLTNSFFQMQTSTQFRYRTQVNFDTSYLPIVIVNTDEYGLEHSPHRHKANMGIIDNGKGNLNRLSDSLNNYNGAVSIKIRGQSSSDFPKRSYNFETQDSFGNNNNVSLLGMPPENDWVLFGPYADKLLFRNEINFILGRNLGHYNPRSKFCELVINGEYMGLYTLREDIKRDSNRINIARLTPEENSGDALTGGYIVRYDKTGDFIVYPKPDSITEIQRNYIHEFFNAYYSTFTSSYFLDDLIGYRNYIDLNFLMDYIILCELTKNADAYLYSTYMYKDRDDRDGRIKFGPFWDNDLIFGNSGFQRANETNGWQFEINKRLRITELLRDEELKDSLESRWFFLRERALHTDSLFFLIDSMANYINEARIRNYKAWPIMNKFVFYDARLPENYEHEVFLVKEWITERLEWIDNNILTIYYPYIPPSNNIDNLLSKQTDFSIYPNPVEYNLNVDFVTYTEGLISIQLIDLYGKNYKLLENKKYIPGQYYLNWNIENINPGIYILRIFQDNNLIFSEKLVKI